MARSRGGERGGVAGAADADGVPLLLLLLPAMLVVVVVDDGNG